jgi:diaminopropionate ammonia-lyase
MVYPSWQVRNAFGAKAVIYLAETVPVSFQEKLRSIGAEVVVEGVDYEASMSAAEQSAKENDWFLLSDSTWPGYAVGADVMKGYMLSAKEIVEQCPEPPTHLFLQAGVGGLAAAMALYLREAYGPDLRIIVVEPDRAPALQAAVQLGTLCDAGEGVSSMGRLDCKRASLSALDALARNANDFTTLTDRRCRKSITTIIRTGLGHQPLWRGGFSGSIDWCVTG